MCARIRFLSTSWLGEKKEMRKTLGGVKHHWRPVYKSSATGNTNNTSFVTVLDITGRGKAAVFSGNYHWISEKKLETEVYIDGTTTYFYRPSRNSIFRGDFHFNISFRVRHRRIDAGIIYTSVAYWLI